MPRIPPKAARKKIGQYEKNDSLLLPADKKRKPGKVKTTPAAIDYPAEPVVCIMLFSRMVVLKNFLPIEMASTAIGIEAETVSQAFNAR